ncbi:hypothetical protein SORBI_3002G219333 [Sorghum bicolor]|uniref:Uncharacterized protein n=1 Tax=Sorghum bicolor TaxID=4558 RepID=A0A1W0W5G4_SORBI|nr:hypothetical protein SORBI_3002G219333 [Sorghum bicolor]
MVTAPGQPSNKVSIFTSVDLLSSMRDDITKYKTDKVIDRAQSTRLALTN